ncbi:flagellar basal-body MS-ring/collar protein FliF [Paracoccaceae bacterium Fryx2]|nr:flagellar basal-body MS-ring/collar protein FliF [Paracoccaceae bacterium Fryx2]
MQNLATLWSSLSMTRRAIVVGATVAMFLAVLALSRLAGAPGMALLYSGLDSGAAGEVVAALDQRGVKYEVRGDSIHVDATQRDSLRMTLAAEGLPTTGAVGYELLDGLSGFGTTSQMFDAAYWRAKEGELARTILASPQIRAARVHIAQAPTQPFQRDQRSTASVTVTTTTGSLPPMQAKALKHLVAASVSGLQPEDVAVIDSVGGLIASGEEVPLPGAGGEDRAALLRTNVERMLAARVGPGKAVVEVTVDVVTDREHITERRFDPKGRVAISSETEERSTSSTDPAGDVTVASNLPEGDAGAGGTGKSQSSETTERVNYEVSETQRELTRSPGSIRKLSVAVLIDGLRVTGEDGTVTLQPRPEEELAVLRELVASAVGLDETRGDVLTLKSLAFEPMVEGGTLVEAGLLPSFGPIDVMSVIQIAVLGLVALVLGLFVIRPLLLSAPRDQPALPAPPAPLALPGMYGTGDGGRVLTGEIDDGLDLPPLSIVSPDENEDPSDPMVRLRRLIEERQSESVEILRGWMEAEEERA